MVSRFQECSASKTPSSSWCCLGSILPSASTQECCQVPFWGLSRRPYVIAKHFVKRFVLLTSSCPLALDEWVACWELCRHSSEERNTRMATVWIKIIQNPGTLLNNAKHQSSWQMNVSSFYPAKYGPMGVDLAHAQIELLDCFQGGQCYLSWASPALFL